MMNQIESFIFKAFMWVIGVMATAIFTMVALTYQSQMETANLIKKHISEQTVNEQYAIKRLNSDSLSIINLQEENGKFKTILRKLDPEAFMAEFYDEQSFFLTNKTQAIINKNEYSLKNLTQ